MKFDIIGRKIPVSEKNSESIKKKISKLDKFFDTEPDARVVLSTIKDKITLEVTLYIDGLIFRAEVTNEDLLTATDKAVDIIERQIRKNKTKIEKKIKHITFENSTLLSGDAFDDTENEEYSIIKTKRFPVKPMSVEEAILQMNLLGHSFFVFRNQDTDEINVVYKRKDGNFAIIESAE